MEAVKAIGELPMNPREKNLSSTSTSCEDGSDLEVVDIVQVPIHWPEQGPDFVRQFVDHFIDQFVTILSTNLSTILSTNLSTILSPTQVFVRTEQ